MSASGPIICKDCWAKGGNWYDCCPHVQKLVDDLSALRERCRLLGVVAETARDVANYLTPTRRAFMDAGMLGKSVFDALDQALRDLDGSKAYPQSPVDNAGTT